jgi:hypothetical protein
MAEQWMRAKSCPSCREAVEPDWMACPACGVSFDPPRTVSGRGAARAPQLEETEQVAVIGVPGGARRPITVMSDRPITVSEAGPSLRAMLASRADVEGPPPEPPTEAANRPITIVHAEVVEPPPAAEAPEVPEAPAAEEVEPPLDLGPRAAAPEPPQATALPPTVLVVQQSAPRDVRQAARSPEEMAEIERLIDAAVVRAFHEHDQHLAAAPQQQASVVAATVAPRARLAAGGVGLLTGGALGNLVVLNWDVWVRGEAGVVVGWLQQTGIMGMAALIGAGAAVALLGASKSWRRVPRASRGAAN